MGILKDIRTKSLHSLSGIALLFCVLLVPANQANAHCQGNDCVNVIREHHTDPAPTGIRHTVNQHTSEKFTEHRDWLVENFFKEQVLPALMLFTEQMSAVAMQQTLAIGAFLDAKHQMETQRLFQELQVQAHKDYQPSEDFCYFGTGVRSLAASESEAQTNAYLLSRRQMSRHLGQKSAVGAANSDDDKYARWQLFKGFFCDPQDSDWNSTATQPGLEALCEPTVLPYVTNADIDYTRLVDSEKTIALNPVNVGLTLTSGGAASPEQRAIFSLNNNLYGNNILTRDVTKAALQQQSNQAWYLALRSVAAKRSVAEASFNAIVGMKSEGTNGTTSGSSHDFLGAIMVELGVADGDVEDIIGLNPSYYAQLELLAKKMYQNPDFYSNLYDKPANVARKSVALKAIELMVDRAIYESQMRQEMVSSVLLSAKLREPFKEAQRGLTPR